MLQYQLVRSDSHKPAYIDLMIRGNPNKEKLSNNDLVVDGHQFSGEINRLRSEKLKNNEFTDRPYLNP